MGAFGQFQSVAVTSQFAGKQPLTRRPAPGDQNPPPRRSANGPIPRPMAAGPAHHSRLSFTFDGFQWEACGSASSRHFRYRAASCRRIPGGRRGCRRACRRALKRTSHWCKATAQV